MKRREKVADPDRLHVHLPPNPEGRDFVVGDLHGCVEDLFQKLGEVSFDTQVDRLFSVGDLIDRGPDSVGAIKLLGYSWFYAVRGNHEDMMVRAMLLGEEMTELLWMRNGGDWAECLDRDLLHAWAFKLAQLPYAISVGSGESRFNIVHAEFFGSDKDLDGNDWGDDVKSQLLWGRSLIQRKVPKGCQQGLSKTYCGHTITSEITHLESQVFIDTGAYLKHSEVGGSGQLSLLRACP